MSGVSVDMAPPNPTDIDFRAVMDGGANFLARAQSIAEERSRLQVAYANLRVGEDARAALDDAKTKQTEAAAVLDEANRTLAQAQQTAAETIQKAREQAAGLIKNAQDEAGASINEASITKSDADTYAKGKRQLADDSLKNAMSIEEDSTATNQQLKAALAAAVAEKAAHEDAKAKADALAGLFQSKIDALHAAIDQVKAS